MMQHFAYSSDHETIIATSRSCVEDALAMCPGNIHTFWQEKITECAEKITEEISSTFTSALCEASK